MEKIIRFAKNPLSLSFLFFGLCRIVGLYRLAFKVLKLSAASAFRIANESERIPCL
ncbi:MAG: hypothetical protein KH054_00770 [Firmicutes bacterium]|nr:hypothetical protein [Bacillota bacterium]